MEFKYDLLKLREICNMRVEEFMDGRYGEVVSNPASGYSYYNGDLDGRYSFKDNGSRILGVAHVDTVVFSKLFTWSGGSKIGSGQFDDRLGVYVLTEILPQLGITFDLLLCADEEDGATTAQFFKSSKQYNWIFEFDRRGDDVVLYQYWGDEWEAALKSAGFDRQYQGSYSDISKLGHLGAKAVNIGVAYDDACHSTSCTADLRMLRSQVMKFKRFYDMYKDVAFEHDPKSVVRKYSSYSSYGGYDDDWWTDKKWEEYYGGASSRLSSKTSAKHEPAGYSKITYLYSPDGCRRWDTMKGDEDMDWLELCMIDEDIKQLLPAAPVNIYDYQNGLVPGYEEYGEIVDWDSDSDEGQLLKVANGELVYINPNRKTEHETEEDRYYKEQLDAQGICANCEDPNCYGVGECQDCHSWTHDDMFVAFTGYCSACAASRGITKQSLQDETFDW